MIPTEWLPAACIVIPLIAGVVIAPTGFVKSKYAHGIVAAAMSALTMVFIGFLIAETSKGEILVHLMAGWKPPVGIVLAVDMFNAFIAMIVSLLILLVAVFSIRYVCWETGLNYYYAFIMLILGGMLGVILTGDIFNLFVFMELTGISAYGLTVFKSYKAEALEAGFRYLVLGAVGTSLLLLGVALLYGAVGTVNYADLARHFMNGKLISGVNGNTVIPVSLMLIIAGLGVKAAFFPLHPVHLDATSESPSPIGAILSGAETKVGIYAICRVLFLVFPVGIVDWKLLIGIISLCTMTFGNIAALMQNDIKRMLAYSSIAHIGYILIGVAAGGLIGISGALLHIFNHGVMKGISFLCAGIFLSQVGTRKLNELSGVGRKLPITTIILSITFLSLIGVPPLSGFVSKFILFTSGIVAGMTWLVIAGIVNSAISAGYYLRFLKALIRFSSNPKIEEAREASPLMLASPLILLSLLVVFGVWPQPLIELSNQAALSLLAVEKYVSTVLGG
jgi:multicomponent Na+:H+ antiporter subunit D